MAQVNIEFVAATEEGFTRTEAHYFTMIDGKKYAARSESDLLDVLRRECDIQIPWGTIERYEAINRVDYPEDEIARMEKSYEAAIARAKQEEAAAKRADDFKAKVMKMVEGKPGAELVRVEGCSRVGVYGVREYSSHSRRTETTFRDRWYNVKDDGTFNLKKVLEAAEEVSSYLAAKRKRENENETRRTHGEALVQKLREELPDLKFIRDDYGHVRLLVTDDMVEKLVAAFKK